MIGNDDDDSADSDQKIIDGVNPNAPKPTFGYIKNPCYYCGGRGYTYYPSGAAEECWHCSGTGVGGG